MILNNLSILPFYTVTSANPTPLEHEKWWVYGHIYPLFTPGIPPIMVQGSMSTMELWRLGPDGQGGTQVSYIYPDGSKVIDGKTYTYRAGSVLALSPGRYELETWIDGVFARSDIFTIFPSAVADAYLKLEWWDDNDFVMDAGAIIYNNGGGINAYKNELYLATDLAKPDYTFTEDGENRDGYFFPIKQLSAKRYRFAIFAPEYLLDIMRLIRMSDHIKITYRGQEFYPDTFLMTPTWENNGDLASVICEFETNTIAKKIGRLVNP